MKAKLIDFLIKVLKWLGAKEKEIFEEPTKSEPVIFCNPSNEEDAFNESDSIDEFIKRIEVK